MRLKAALTTSCLSHPNADKAASMSGQELHKWASMQDRITNDGRLVTGSLQPAADTWERAPHVPLTAPAVPPISTEVADLLSQYNLTSTELGMHDGLAATTRCHDTMSPGAGPGAACGLPAVGQQRHGAHWGRRQHR